MDNYYCCYYYFVVGFPSGEKYISIRPSHPVRQRFDSLPSPAIVIEKGKKSKVPHKIIDCSSGRVLQLLIIGKLEKLGVRTGHLPKRRSKAKWIGLPFNSHRDPISDGNLRSQFESRINVWSNRSLHIESGRKVRWFAERSKNRSDTILLISSPIDASWFATRASRWIWWIRYIMGGIVDRELLLKSNFHRDEAFSRYFSLPWVIVWMIQSNSSLVSCFPTRVQIRWW